MWNNRIWDAMDRVFGSPVALADRTDGTPTTYPALNLWEDDENLFLEAELPGLSQERIEITVAEGDQLTIAGERQTSAPQGCIWHRQECGYGRFSRTVTLPVVVDADKVEAHYESGVLSVTLPKSEMAKPKRIAVKAAESARVTVSAS